MYDDIGKLIEPILPKLKLNIESIKEKITKKYTNKETDVLE
jgi:hypothetical protein